MLFKPTVMQIKGVDGALYTLTDESFTGAAILLREGAKGLDSPTFDVKADEYPAIDGGFVRFARAAMREIFLPVTIHAPTRFEMMALKRRFIASLNPKKGLVQLQSTEFSLPAGFTGEPTLDDLVPEPTRAITCFAAGGLEGGEGSENGTHYATYGLILRAPTPYFQTLARTVQTFQVFDVVEPFIEPATFLSLDGSTEGAGLQISSNPAWTNAVTLTNPGDVEAQPRWEIRGPLESRFSLVLKDATGETVKELRFHTAFPITQHQVLVIETAKGAQMIRLYDQIPANGDFDPTQGNSMWWAYDVTSEMWALEPGADNPVALVVDKPDGLSPEEETAWNAANQPNVTVSFLPSYLGI
ncbi:phage tail family protein [Nonomuraea candida]|uniref:phage tail family protein n=1 Tax=Nonomuraea candida TaxID=359159 RepID=UPI0005BAB25D|nr:phage tail family protein [Nonomuraea candida]